MLFGAALLQRFGWLLRRWGEPSAPPGDSAPSASVALQKALLNDCATKKEEIMLAVAWGDPAILQAQLEGNQDAAAAHRLAP